jgi:superoxide dismutase, Cu-Zn family
MRTRIVMTFAAVALLAGCASTTRMGMGAELVTMRDAAGRTVGTAMLIPGAEGVQVVLQVHGMEPGVHAVHIHERLNCEPPDFMSAGGHFNPHGREHGFQNPRGYHAGDLPNLEVGPDGRGVLNGVAVGTTLAPEGENSLRRPGGTSLVIHASADDYRTDPSGNSGARIACGEVRVIR